MESPANFYRKEVALPENESRPNNAQMIGTLIGGIVGIVIGSLITTILVRFATSVIANSRHRSAWRIKPP
jgi:tetrahydromethanopterin S-methyltransferase subunit G